MLEIELNMKTIVSTTSTMFCSAIITAYILLVGCSQNTESEQSVTSNNVQLNVANPSEPSNVTAIPSVVTKETVKIEIPNNVLRGVLVGKEHRPILRIINYGNGVYYFPYTRAHFLNVLSWFKSQNTNLVVTAISVDAVNVTYRTYGGHENVDYNKFVGYIVNTEKR
jgi:hypothetical protein